MSQMMLDLLDKVYTRISGLGQSIKSLEGSIETLNKNVDAQVSKLNETIKDMKVSTDKDGQYSAMLLKQIGEAAVKEVQKLQENVGLTALVETTDNLKNIIDLSQDALNPETVDVVLGEVLGAIKNLSGKGESQEKASEGEAPPAGSAFSPEQVQAATAETQPTPESQDAPEAQAQSEDAPNFTKPPGLSKPKALKKPPNLKKPKKP